MIDYPIHNICNSFSMHQRLGNEQHKKKTKKQQNLRLITERTEGLVLFYHLGKNAEGT